MIPVLMSGGSGKRLWPFSRTFYPKQFCSLFEEPLIVSTALRLREFGSPVLLTNQNFRALTEKTFGRYHLEIRTALYEPLSRNTAPAIAFLTRFLEENHLLSEAVGVFPCDHVVHDAAELRRASTKAASLAVEKKATVIIGIQPDFPATGYGYIRTNEDGSVSRFEEKPTEARARELLANKNCLWNSGIVISTGATLRSQFKMYQPELWKTFSKLSFSRPEEWPEIFGAVPDLSFDVGILEKLAAGELTCVPCSPGWSDVGSWDAYTKVYTEQAKSRVTIESQNTSIISQQSKTYVAIGVNDLTIVDTEDACLIFKKGDSEKLKSVISEVAKENPPVVDHAVNDVRPWGAYSVLQETPATKVKCVKVDPGARLSYQSHQKREEHWIVTHGSGVVTLEGKEIPVVAGTYVNIPSRAKHRIANTGTVMLEFVEVQLGTYLGEDDIARFQDDYVRSSKTPS